MMGLSVVRKIENPGFEPTIEGNAGLTLSWNLAGELVQIDKIVGAFTYRKSLTWSGGYPVTVSEWTKLP